LKTKPLNNKWSGIDLLEGHALTLAVDALYCEDVFARLDAWASPADLAKSLNLEEDILGVVLEYVYIRTDFLKKQNTEYRCNDNYSNNTYFWSLLDQYVGAYGPNLNCISTLMHNSKDGGALVDRMRHAQAFKNSELSGFPEMTDIVAQAGFGAVLDIGCGNAGLLTALAQMHPQFKAWGVDSSSQMCGNARAQIAQLNLTDRVQIYQSDAKNISAILSEKSRAQIQAIIVSSLLNEFFFKTPEPAIEWLKELRSIFPGRILIVADYYGKLGKNSPGATRLSLLHDFVQLLSAQGIPPSNKEGWNEIYQQAGCKLSQAIEFEDEFPRFIHFVIL